MVTAAIWDAICTFIGWLLGNIPTFDKPAWVDDAGTYVQQGVDFINGMHWWVPVDALRNGLVFLLAVGVAVFAVRAARILVSLFTGGGGGAA